MGPPSSGQVAVQQIMGVLETQDMASLKPGPDAVHWIAEAGRLAMPTGRSSSPIRPSSTCRSRA